MTAAASPLRAARIARGLRQSDLEQLAGLPATSVSHFEAGRRRPDAAQLRRIAAVLDVADSASLNRPVCVIVHARPPTRVRVRFQNGADAPEIVLEETFDSVGEAEREIPSLVHAYGTLSDAIAWIDDAPKPEFGTFARVFEPRTHRTLLSSGGSEGGPR